jgi:MFS family permease
MQTVLRNRDFRSLVVGRLVTNAGDSLYSVAAMWLVWELTYSPGMTALAGFLTRLPSVLQMFAGPLVDRWSLRRVLVWTQLVQAVLVLAVPAAWYLDGLTVEVVLVVMPLLSLCNQLVYPAQAALVPRLVEKAELVSANSALALAYQSADLVFNALAGILVAAVGAVALYLVDSVTFVVAALLFLSIRIPAAGASPDAPESAPAVADGGEEVDGESTDDADGPYLADLREGVGYVRGTIVLPLLFGGVVANFALAATFPVLPAFSAAVTGSEMGFVTSLVGTLPSATIYGALLGAFAAGSLLGSLLASGLSGQPYGRLAIVGFLVSGVCWLGALAVPGVLATVLLFGLASVPIGATNVVAGAMIQSLVPETLLGRVSSVATSLTVALTPLGALVGGVVAETVSVEAAVVLGGAGLLFIAVYTFAMPSLRRLPPVGEMETLALE